MYFSNSNLDSREEYERRLAEARKVAAAEGVELEADAYDHGRWLREVAAGYEDEPEKGCRCERCFAYSLARTAEFLGNTGYDAFCTSLTVSPHKPSAVIFASSGDSRFLKEDFKKKEGFRLSVRRAAELGLYRQTYCGCEFSKRKTEERNAART
jgi:predicted adenine nucleotide alpha hydrolase (AANH) superfamily ATPase